MKHTFDTTIRPQDDFFGYVNNPWLQNNPIPPSESSWGTFYVLRDQSWKAVSDIIDELLSRPKSETHSEHLLQDFFTAALHFDDHKMNHQSTIDRELAKISEISSSDELVRYLGYAHRNSFNVFFGPYVDIDDKNSQLQVLRISQRGLGMPNRDYYLEDSEKMRAFREAYRQYHKDLSEALGTDTDFDTVFALEKRLAEASWTDVKLRDIEQNYNRHTISELQAAFAIDWGSYFAELGWKEPSDNIVVGQPSFMTEISDILRTTQLDTIKMYLTWRVISSLAGWTSQKTYDIHFAFYETALGGVTEQKPLWKRAVMMADSLVIGEALGKTYAERHFPETSKTAILSMVEDIRSAYRRRIEKLTWMDESTKLRAHAKLDNMKVFVGYPTVWRDVSTLTFAADNVLDNVIAARRLDSDYELAKIGTSPAEEEWEMHAHTVNAYHHPNRLEIVFPAAILQPPFYDPEASYAANLGGIGAVIGHEFTHGFDDQGAQFDEYGNVDPWQSATERAEFDRRAKLIVEQADAFETVPGVKLQGELVLGEAIADVGGLQLAVEALQAHDPVPADYEDLFVTFARAECGSATTERLIQLAKIDPHPPSPFRVNAVVNHIDQFYTTYKVAENDGLFREPSQRSQIW